MNLTALNPQQLAAAAIAGLVISAGQNGNAANIVKRANTALAVGAAITQLGQGNAQPGFDALSAALANSNLDPGVIVALQGMLNFGIQQAVLFQGVKGAIPVFGDVAEAVAINVGAGVTAAANAEIAKYGPQLQAPSSSSAAVAEKGPAEQAA